MTKAEFCGTEAVLSIAAAVPVILVAENISASLQMVHGDRHQEQEVSASRWSVMRDTRSRSVSLQIFHLGQQLSSGCDQIQNEVSHLLLRQLRGFLVMALVIQREKKGVNTPHVSYDMGVFRYP